MECVDCKKCCAEKDGIRCFDCQENDDCAMVFAGVAILFGPLLLILIVGAIGSLIVN